MAKRQREAEKRDKAARKREKREQRQHQSSQSATQSGAINSSYANTAPADSGRSRVLSIFRRYLMSTGQMLCLSGHELEGNRQTLDQLISDGLLIAESFKGAYSLTETGYEAMRNLARDPA